MASAAWWAAGTEPNGTYFCLGTIRAERAKSTSCCRLRPTYESRKRKAPPVRTFDWRVSLHKTRFNMEVSDTARSSPIQQADIACCGSLPQPLAITKQRSVGETRVAPAMRVRRQQPVSALHARAHANSERPSCLLLLLVRCPPSGPSGQLRALSQSSFLN
jgi:hypothetical protein